MRPDGVDEKKNEPKPNPCAICGRHSTSKAWGFWLCWGEGERAGCMSRLGAVMPFEGEKEFTATWVKEQRKGRAA